MNDLTLLTAFLSILEATSPVLGSGNGTAENIHGIHLVSWRWDEYSSTILFTLMIILASAFKIGFHQIHFLSKCIPESCVLIILGCIAGVLVNYCLVFSPSHPFPTFNSNLFFNVLLPPVILDSAYSLYDREFISNLGSVIIFAIFGTLFNIFLVGGILRGIFMSGGMGSGIVELSFMECLIFASLISAVDPVAVLAIFEEIGVNIGLYFLVFGESLLNDGVTIVIYNTVTALEDKGGDILLMDYLMALASFFSVAGGGFLIGILFGVLSAILLKYTKDSRVIEPTVIVSMAYLSFVLAETFHWSGIMALIGCGVTQKRYTFPNASNKTRSTVKYGIQALSSVSDAIIFLFLGTVCISKKHDFQLSFVLWTLLLITVIRFIGVFILSAIINTIKTKPILLREQFIMAYGGLRGAVGFSLAVLIPDSKVYKDMIITTTLIVIFFTVFIQGGTIKLFVNLLHIKRKEENKESYADIIHGKLIDQVMGGVESITGNVSKYRIIALIEYVEREYIMKYLLSANSLINMEIKLRDITMDDHYARLFGPTVLASEEKVGYIMGHEDFSFYPGLVSRTYSNEYLIQPQVTTWDNSSEKSASKSLKKLLERSPYERYKRRFYRRSNNPFDDGFLRQLDANRKTASRIKRIICERDERKKLFAYNSMGMKYLKQSQSKEETKDSNVKLIQNEYQSAKQRFKPKKYQGPTE